MKQRNNLQEMFLFRVACNRRRRGKNSHLSISDDWRLGLAVAVGLIRCIVEVVVVLGNVEGVVDGEGLEAGGAPWEK